MNAFVEARFYRNRIAKDFGQLVAVDRYGRLFPIDRINEEWTPNEQFEAIPETTMTWEEFVSESQRLNPGMPKEYPRGNDAPVQ